MIPGCQEINSGPIRTMVEVRSQEKKALYPVQPCSASIKKTPVPLSLSRTTKIIFRRLLRYIRVTLPPSHVVKPLSAERA